MHQISRKVLKWVLMDETELASEIYAFSIALALRAKDEDATPPEALRQLADKLPMEIGNEEFKNLKNDFRRVLLSESGDEAMAIVDEIRKRDGGLRDPFAPSQLPEHEIPWDRFVVQGA